MHKAVLVSLCVWLAGCGNTPIIPPGEPIATAAFRSFVDDYFKSSFEFSPSTATAQGFHEYDDKLENFSAESYKNRVTTLNSLASRLAGLQKQQLTLDESIDAALIDGQIKAELQDIQILETWKRNPMGYIGLPGGAIDGLIKRNFAPKADRLRSVIARLRKVDDLLKQMKVNMVLPPPEFTDLAARMSKGSIGFFKDTLADWAKDAAGSDKTLLKDFEGAN